MPIDADVLQEMLDGGLKEINMMGQLLYKDDAIILANALAKNPVLEELNLDRSRFGDEGAKSIASALSKNTHLKKLHLNNCNLTDEGAKALAEGLAQNSSLETVAVYGNEIGDEGAIAFADALGKNKTLKRLTLDYNRIGEQGAIAIADKLQHHPLKGLGLGSNCLGDEGAVAIAKAGGELESLTLFRNLIGDEGAEAVAEHLFKKGKLETLDISTNRIGVEGAQAMVDALASGSVLHSLLLSDNKIGKAGIESFADFMRDNDTMATLFLDQKPTSTETVDAVASAISGRNHKNLMQFTPRNDSVDAVVGKNSDDNKALCERLQKTLGTPNLKISDMLEAGQRQVAIRDITHRLSDKFSANLPIETDAMLAALPVLSGEPTREKLLQKDERGLTPLDNAATWQNIDSLLPLFDKAFLSQKNADGEPLFINAAHCGKLPEIIEKLNRGGEILTPAELLAEDGKTASPLLTHLAEAGEAGQLFTFENWKNQSAQAMRKVYDALPEDAHSQVKNFHSLQQQITSARPATAGLGR